MELIKKQVQRILTTATTQCDDGGNDCFVYVPNTSVNYNFKILLEAKDVDQGFFEVSDVPNPYSYGYYGDLSGIGLSLFDD